MLFVTHEDLQRTPVARAMFDDMARQLESEFLCTVLAGSDRELCELRDGNVNRLSFRRKSTGQLSARDIVSYLYFIVRRWRCFGKYDLYFVRSYPSMLALAPIGWLCGIPIVFDTRGLFFHELHDSGKLRGVWWTRYCQVVERWLLKAANCVLCVSESQRDYYRELLDAEHKYEVIYNGAPVPGAIVEPRAPDGAYVIGYVGSLGRWHLPEAMAELLRALVRQGVRLEFHCITDELGKASDVFGDIRDAKIYSHPYRYQPIKFDLGLCLIRDSLSKRVCFPVKFSEYLAANTPVLFSNNIDVCVQLNRVHGVGLEIDVADGADANAAKVMNYLRNPKRQTVKLPNELSFRHQVRAVRNVVERNLRSA